VRRTDKDNGLLFRMMTKKCHHSGKNENVCLLLKDAAILLILSRGVNSNNRFAWQTKNHCCNLVSNMIKLTTILLATYSNNRLGKIGLKNKYNKD
jgi:hypothetical protein